MILGPVILGIFTGALAFVWLWSTGALVALIGAQLVGSITVALGAVLLARTKGLQLASFVILALLLTPLMGPLGTALAVVATDLVVQFGLLGLAIIRETLQRPVRHVMFLVALMVAVTACGWGLGLAIHGALPLTGLTRFVAEAGIWLAIVALAVTPLASARLRNWLEELIPG